MKYNRSNLLVLSVLACVVILVSACGPTTTPTAIPPTAAPEPVTLTVLGMVNNELDLTDSALHGMTVVTLTLEHPKNGATEYTGVRLNDLLAQASIQAGATTVTLTASDGFSADVDLATVQACTDCLVAFDADNAGVYNAAMAGQSSKAWVKGVISIEVK